MDLLLQIWGGGCYLTNKILFSFAENQNETGKRTLKIYGWVIYILGVPAWATILILHHNWIAASVEFGGIPAMLLGLYNTIHNHQKQNRTFNWFVSCCTYSSLAVGLAFSAYHYGGITSVTQLLEVGVMLGFLLGSYLLAKGNSNGWLLFILMNLSMSTLMGIQEKPVLMAQQLVSLSFVLYGFIKARSNQRLSARTSSESAALSPNSY